MTAPGVMAICDALAALLEPDAELRDDSRMLPRGGSEWAPGTLYLWPRRESFGPDGQGQLDRRTFSLRAAWVAADANARAGGSEDRDVSDAIAQRVEDMRLVVRGNRALNDGAGDPVWEWMQVDAIDWESLRTTDARGAYVDITGYVLPAQS